MEGLKRKLAKLFYSRSPTNATYSSDPMLDQHITNMCYIVINDMVPHEKVSNVVAIAAATVVLVVTTAAGVCGKTLAGDVAATYFDAMDEDVNARHIKKWIPPIHMSNDITGNSSNGTIITARQELTAYAGIAKGITIELMSTTGPLCSADACTSQGAGRLMTPTFPWNVQFLLASVKSTARIC